MYIAVHYNTEQSDKRPPGRGVMARGRDGTFVDAT